MDKECRNLCDAINTFSGIETTESCCGHGKYPYNIWFKAKDLKSLPPLLYWFDSCHCGFYGWEIIARTDCGCSPVIFMIEGGIGEAAYKEAEKIAQLIKEEVKGND